MRALLLVCALVAVACSRAQVDETLANDVAAVRGSRRLTVIYRPTRWECASCQVGIVAAVKEIAPQLPEVDFVLSVPVDLRGEAQDWPGRVHETAARAESRPQVVGDLVMMDVSGRVLCYRELARGTASVDAFRAEVRAVFGLTSPLPTEMAR